MDTKIFILVAVIKIALVAFLLLTGVAYMTWLERKVIGRIQNRWGPTRVGPFGLLQPLADGIKFILKEDMVPDKVHKVLYIMAPMLALTMSLISIAVIPFGETISVPKQRAVVEDDGRKAQDLLRLTSDEARDIRSPVLLSGALASLAQLYAIVESVKDCLLPPIRQFLWHCLSKLRRVEVLL